MASHSPKQLLAVGEGGIEPDFLPDGTPAIPLQRNVTNEDGSEDTCSIEGTTYFEQLHRKYAYPKIS